MGRRRPLSQLLQVAAITLATTSRTLAFTSLGGLVISGRTARSCLRDWTSCSHGKRIPLVRNLVMEDSASRSDSPRPPPMGGRGAGSAMGGRTSFGTGRGGRGSQFGGGGYGGGGPRQGDDDDDMDTFSRGSVVFDADAKGAAGYAARGQVAPPKRNDKRGTGGEDGPKKVKPGAGRREKRVTSVDEEDDDALINGSGRGGRPTRRGGGRSGRGSTLIAPPRVDRPVRITTSTMSVADLAEAMDTKPGEVVKYLMINMGIMATVTQTIDAESAAAVALAFGKKVVRQQEEGDSKEAGEAADGVASSGLAIDEDSPESMIPRPPVVTIMGHVDHGKTTLLDAIRNAKVASGEAGGITQAIGAYQVTTTSGQEVTFIDTPGHAAFSEMRSRGANSTDVVVLVVAADDGVKEQTRECIATAKLANVPVVVAINKMDKPGADPMRILNELMKYDLLSTEFGGEVEVGKISAKTGDGLDDLLEKILLQAEVLDLRANPNRAAQGVVIEARQQIGLGAVTTTLIQRGTLRIGDVIVAGGSCGKVKLLMDHTGKKVLEAVPSMPVQVVGLDSVPNAGDAFVVVDKEETARVLAESRRKILRETQAAQMQGDLKGNVEAILSGLAQQDGKEKLELNIVLRADGPGSAEALANSLRELVSEDEYFKVNCKILTAGVGELTKSDIAVAGVSNAFVICFNVPANHQAQEDARRSGIEIGYYNIVYDVLDEIGRRLNEIRSPTPEGVYIGKAKVKAIFNIGKVGNIAGCEVLDGEVRKGSKVRVMRMGRVVAEGKLKTLKNLKADADMMVAGTECGIQLSDFEDFQEGDFVECYIPE